jgi:hypothetical protein
MGKIAAFLLTMPFLIILIFQPYLAHLEESRGKVVQSAIQRSVERAAVDGYFTAENIEEMEKQVMSVGYSKEEIEFQGNLTPVLRGEYIEGSLKAPNEFQFILIESLLTNEVTENYHFHKASRMSEYVN